MNRADWLVLACGLLLVAFLYQRYWFAEPGHAQFAEIRVADQPARLEPLEPDRLLRVAGRLGESILEIRDHAIRFRSSPCRNQVCVRSGWLGDNGAVAACLPNLVSIHIPGGESRYDAINF